MPRGKRWPTEFKAKVVLETLAEDRTVAQVAADHELNPKMVSKWRSEFVDHADRVFSAERDAAERERELAEHRGEVDDLHRMIGEPAAGRDRLQRRALAHYGIDLDEAGGPDRPVK